MFEAFLVTTSSDGLQPLGSAPQRSFELVSSTIRDRLGSTHANLFAEPVATEHGDMIDWHAPMAGKAVPLPELPEAEQAEVKQALGALVTDIQCVADELADSTDASDQRLGEALANAIEIPDEAMVHVVRDTDGALHPVLVHWGWVRDEQKSVRGILTAMVPRARPVGADAALAITASAPVGWTSPVWWWLILLGWLLLAALLALILYLLIAPCGVNQGRLVFCPADETALSAADLERQVIEDRILRLEHELALKDRVCKPTIPLQPSVPNGTAPETAPVTPVPDTPESTDPTPVDPPKVDDSVPLEPEDSNQTEADRDDADRRITERGAERGDLNFVLEWSTTDDIDLEVTCPTGQVISYKNPTDCNGTYDLDANVKRDTAIEDPIENIVFQPAQPGLYKVRAHLKGIRTDGDKTVTLHVLRRDGPSQSYSGVVSEGRREWTLNISISR